MKTSNTNREADIKVDVCCKGNVKLFGPKVEPSQRSQDGEIESGIERIGNIVCSADILTIFIQLPDTGNINQWIESNSWLGDDTNVV